jgi:hypothetical protein
MTERSSMLPSTTSPKAKETSCKAPTRLPVPDTGEAPTVAVKITDMLGEETLVIEALSPVIGS